VSDSEKKHISGLDEEQYKQWRELSKDHWSRWRAWGSWFSWGSPVGLGLFFVLLAVTFAVFKFALGL